MKSIKSFIYLDEVKMYSVSSQLFEGLTDHIINYKLDRKSAEEEQKGPFSSGRKLADIIIKEGGTKEIKFLHDYSYTLFEDELIKDNKVLQINPENFDNEISKINEFSFIKISGRCQLLDVNMVHETLGQFNKIGEAVTYCITQEVRQAAKKDLGDKNLGDKQKLKELKKLENVKKLAQEMGLSHDQELINNLILLTKYGYKDHFEVQIPLPDFNETKYLFSSLLSREYLKEKEDAIVKKYSRTSEKVFTLFGFTTQSNLGEPTDSKIIESPIAQDNMKKSLKTLILSFGNMENFFIGKLPNEIIIDPIALYREL